MIVGARPAGRSVEIRVIDRGPGIPVVDQERIFEPFYRVPGAADAPHVGSGLGLAIAKGFVEANGGRIWVESTPGRGTRLAISLIASPEPRA